MMRKGGSKEGKRNKRECEGRKVERERRPGRRNGAATTRFLMQPSVPVVLVHLPHMRHSHPRRHRRVILRPAVTTGVRPYVKAGVCSSLAVVARLGLFAFRSHFATWSLASSFRSKLDRGRDLDLNRRISSSSSSSNRALSFTTDSSMSARYPPAPSSYVSQCWDMRIVLYVESFTK